jgi:hypothetical protein
MSNVASMRMTCVVTQIPGIHRKTQELAPTEISNKQVMAIIFEVLGQKLLGGARCCKRNLARFRVMHNLNDVTDGQIDFRF